MMKKLLIQMKTKIMRMRQIMRALRKKMQRVLKKKMMQNKNKVNHLNMLKVNNLAIPIRHQNMMAMSCFLMLPWG
jgi:hypothetical protein